MQFAPLHGDHVETLVQLGLNPSQAKIYLVLSGLGSTNVTILARACGIDRAEVYRQLENLCDKDLVTKVIAKPNKYKPHPLKEVLDGLLHKKQSDCLFLEKKIKHLRKVIITPPPPSKSNESFIIRHNSKQWVKIGQNTKEWVLCTNADYLPITLTRYHKSIGENYKKQTHIRIIAQINNPKEQTIKFIEKYVKENPFCEIRFCLSNVPFYFAISDQNYLFILDIAKDKKGTQSLCLTNPTITKRSHDYFEYKWKKTLKESPNLNPNSLLKSLNKNPN